MGLLDDVLGTAVPEGNLAKPVMIAAAALLGARAIGGGGLGNLFGGGPATSPTPGTPAAGSDQPAPGQGGLLGGLSALVQSFHQNGHGDVINSWIGSGQNQSITPEQMHQALGPQAVENLARLTGVPASDLMSELSGALPGIIDRLTPHGRMPNQAETAHW